MDPSKAKLINAKGEETEFAIPGLKKGDPIPQVLICKGVLGWSLDHFYVIDSGEIAKRFWTEIIYRETEAVYI